MLMNSAKVGNLSPELASTSSSTKAAAEVTQVALAPGGQQLAAGYSDGTVRLWDMASRSCQVTLTGHSGAITCLGFSANGALLASGSADTSAIVWDVVGEAGLVRFKGHKDAVTDLALIHQGSHLISSSKDGCVKVWDVTLQHCCQTLIGFKGEVWSLAVNPDETRMVAGCVDSDLRVYSIRNPDAGGAAAGVQGAAAGASTTAAAAAAAGSDSEDEAGMRTGQERVGLIRYDARGQLLGVMGAGKGLEVFSVRDAEAALKKMKRRRKRKDAKAAAGGQGGAKAAKTAAQATPGQAAAAAAAGADVNEQHDAAAAAPQASDELGSLLVLTSKHKLKSFAFSPARSRRGGLGQLALGLSNNSIEVVDVKEGTYESASKLELPGHRSDVRCLALSSDDTQLLSGSNAGCKLWDPMTGSCLGSIDTGYALCCAYAPGNRHALVGTKEGDNQLEGTIQLVDVGACSVIHSEQAHAGAVWSLALLPDKSGFVSGSADKTIKFWTWAVTSVQQQDAAGAAADAAAGGKKSAKGRAAQEDEAAAAASAGGVVVQQLGFNQLRVLEMADDVLCVRVSPDGRLLAASLLDATIKVYYVDSLKFFLSLYGHKLPALTMDISSDSTLLVTGSADKNIKVWGLDFGDCHKSMFAHQDTITAVAFVRDTHYAFSVSKDRMLKYWDLDRFEMLLEMPGHHAEVWALALSTYGDYIVTGVQLRTAGLALSEDWNATFAEGLGVSRHGVKHHGGAQLDHYKAANNGQVLCSFCWEQRVAAAQASLLAGKMMAMLVVMVRLRTAALMLARGCRPPAGSHDRSMRRWERTSEPFFVEEEKERRLESLFEADLEQQQQRAAREAGGLVLGPEGASFGGGGAAAAGGEAEAAAAAGRRTIESVSAADAIIDALDVAAHEADKDDEYARELRAAQAAAAAAASSQPKKGSAQAAALPKRPPANPLMLGLAADAYVLRSVAAVRANDLEQALLLLPFNDALRLLQWVSGWLAQGSQRRLAGSDPQVVELSCRVATLLLRLHHSQLTATTSARQTLVDLHTRMRAAVQGLRDTLGFNIAALKYMQRAAKENAGVDEEDVVKAARRQLLTA
ncbi:WD40-repeat-containing domain protein [Scenedesmus sp. NREL 46B-D3]|nr:WD40-repeat-containing domain protein [Scenedesmus sp. NREL 46B-D3]